MRKSEDQKNGYISKRALKALCRGFNSANKQKVYNAGEMLSEYMREDRVSPEDLPALINLFCGQMKRTPPNTFDYADVRANIAGNLQAAHWLQYFYKYAEMPASLKQEIKALEGSLVCYNVYEGRKSPHYFKLQSW